MAKKGSRSKLPTKPKLRPSRKAPLITKVPAGYRRLIDSERRPARGAKFIGPAVLSEKVTVRIRVRPRPGSPKLPDIREWTNTAHSERRYLSHQEFTQLYSASQIDIDKVVSFAKKCGLIVTEINVGRRTVMLAGTVRSMQKAFAVQLNRYKTSIETYRGRVGHVHVPRPLASIITGVFGLDNRRMAARASVRAGASPLTPPQVAKLYEFPSNASAAGQTIGLIEFGGGFAVDENGSAPDVDSFFQKQGLASPLLIAALPIDGVGNSPTGDPNGPDGEVLLDIEVAGSVAPGANIAVYFAPWTELGWTEVIAQAVHDQANRPSVLSISWGWSEDESIDGLAWTAAAMKDVSSSFREAAVLGVTVLVASGDDGSNCNINDGAPHVSYPASDPWVTACGGTIITNVVGTAFTENTWNDKISKFGLSSGGATGGGVSVVFDLPDYQVGVGVPHPAPKLRGPSRGIPDIAGNASWYSGYTVEVDGFSQQTGGTSAVAPLYAGLFALANGILQAIGANKLGFINPALYVNRSKMFRDIADGRSNSVDFSGFGGSHGTSPGYQSGVGWDACTGLGVLRAPEFILELLPRPPREWIIDPWRLILYPSYVKLHLPDPPPQDLATLANFLKAIVPQLTNEERKLAATRARHLAAYANLMEKILSEG